MLRRRAGKTVLAWSPESVLVKGCGPRSRSVSRVRSVEMLLQRIRALAATVSFDGRTHPATTRSLSAHERIDCSRGAHDLVSSVNAVSSALHGRGYRILNGLDCRHFLLERIQMAAALAIMAPWAAPAGPPAAKPATPPAMPAPTGRMTSQLR